MTTMMSGAWSLSPSSCTRSYDGPSALDLLLVAALRQDACGASSPSIFPDPDSILDGDDERALDELGPDLAGLLFEEAGKPQSVSQWASRSTGCQPTPCSDEPGAAPDRSGAPETASVPGFTILGKLGHGGMGVVYKARQEVPPRYVALKMIRAEATFSAERRRRFKLEAEAAARLQHSNIVQVYEVGEIQGRPYYSMEFCAGGSLADRLDGSPLPPIEAAKLIKSLAHAVHCAHKYGILHRDLKPSNVLVTADGTPKVSDFGLAKCLDCDSPQTESGILVGTPSYMAPEQASARRGTLTIAADVYSLGAILYELLTGRPPFKGSDPLHTAWLACTQAPVPPRSLRANVPRDLDIICLKCLEKEPQNRYLSGKHLAEDLECFLSGTPISARPVGPVTRFCMLVKRQPTIILPALSMMLALFLCCEAGLTWRHASDLQVRYDQLRAELAQAEGMLDQARGRLEHTTKDCSLALERLRQLQAWLKEDSAAPPGVFRLRQEPALKSDLDQLRTLLQDLFEQGASGRPDAETLSKTQETLSRLRRTFDWLVVDQRVKAAWSLREESEVQGFFLLIEDELKRI
jgi:serine/threonine protein kinase